MLAAKPVFAQIPPAPFIYILGTEIGRNELNASKFKFPGGRPDVWLRMSCRNLGYYLGRPGWGHFVKYFILRTTGGPYHQWDTIPGNGYPLLQVVRLGKKINREDGSIAGFNPPMDGVIDLFITDDGTVASRHTPMELEIVTLDGKWTMEVSPYNMWDNKPQ